MKQITILFMMFSSLECYAQDIDTTIIYPEKNFHFKQLSTPAVLIFAGIFSEINFKKSIIAKWYKERNTDIPHFCRRWCMADRIYDIC